jgi:zinc transport system ATP-binding protein
MAQITCENVSLCYVGKTAVANLHFSVNAGDYLCIVGENGAGKTTLIKALLNLKEASSGIISTGDGLSAHDIGYLPQQTIIQKNFPASVFEIVLSGRLNSSPFKPFYTSADKKDALQKIELVHIAELKNRCYRELSGGQQQRVLLARALCAAKKMILLDEPVAGLDPIATEEMYDSIHKINTSGMTIIMVSHDIKDSLAHATHVLHLADHKQLFFGKVSAYRESQIGKRFLKTDGGSQND